MATPLPPQFCWTRFGTEAGEGIEAICARKELERRRNGGVFLWGIGNALGPSMREFVRLESSPEVVFSPMLTPPRQVDVSPPQLVTWRTARDLDGVYTCLPRWSVVISRTSAGTFPIRHFALVCRSDVPLVFDGHGPAFSVGGLANLLTGRPVGASQVTAVVRRTTEESTGGTTYRQAFRARLAPPYFVQLEDPQLSPPLAAVANGAHARHLEVGGVPSH